MFDLPTLKDNSAVFPHQRHSVPTIFKESEVEEPSFEEMEGRQTMSVQELRAVALYSGQRGLMIRRILESLNRVMDHVQIQQLLLFAQANRMELEFREAGPWLRTRERSTTLKEITITSTCLV